MPRHPPACAEVLPGAPAASAGLAAARGIAGDFTSPVCAARRIPGEELTFPSLGPEDGLISCGPGQFLCRDGSRCVPAAWRCDARDHCPDGIPGEELTFPSLGTEDGLISCGPGQFLCRDGSRCVPAAWRCDARDHCPDGSDEIHCEHLSHSDAANATDTSPCSQGQFRCATGRCIPAAWRCDGDTDCGQRDDSDEDPFTCKLVVSQLTDASPCSQGQFRCATGRCIPAAWRCDGDTDCGQRDDSDEDPFPCKLVVSQLTDASPCSQGQFRGATGRCIPAAWRCDGDTDCGQRDDSDEDPFTCKLVVSQLTDASPCSQGQFRCATGRCIPAAWRCDGDTDCGQRDDSDEDPFTCKLVVSQLTDASPCSQGQFRCATGRCIPAAWRCDGDTDCGQRDDSDEDPFTCKLVVSQLTDASPCSQGQFRCATGRCIPAAWRCDGDTDCGQRDDSDEDPFTCKLVVSQLTDASPCSQGQFRCATGRCIPAAWRCDGDTDCGQRDDSDEDPFTCKLVVSQLTDASPCSQGQFRCATGRCIPAAWRCVGDTDCGQRDDSDEDPFTCKLVVSQLTDASPCSQGQFRCATGRCIPAAWRCDGDTDCGQRDDSDEDPFTCQKEFKCPNNTARCATPLGGVFECVPIRSFCDSIRDCRDGSDEWDICDNFTKAQCGPLKCAEGCRPTHEGLACYCQDGYQHVNGKCEDLDECQQEATCPQWCRNTPGSYTCLCAPGYKLSGGSCIAVNDPPDEPASLLVITQKGISRVWPDGHAPPKKENLTLPALQVKAMDFDYSNRSFCYVHHNLSRSGIMCVSVDDFSKKWQREPPTLFPSVDSVSFMALDWVSGAWYLVDGAAGAMFVCSRDLAHCRLLQDSLAKLRGLAIDPTPPQQNDNQPHGFIFWSVWGGSPARVVRTELWGGAAADLAASRLVYPTALTLDLTNKWLYWVDAYMDSVERSDYYGGNRVTVFRAYESERVSLISNFEASLYLPQWNNQSVLMTSRYARTHARTPTHTQKIIPVSARVTAALVFHRQRQPVVSHPCAVHNGGCTHICVTAWRGTTPRAHCLCRHGYKAVHTHPHQPPVCHRVDVDQYLLVARGSPPIVQAIVTQHPQWEAAAPAAAARPTAADVHLATEYMYFSDVHRYEIVRQKLDGTGREVFIEEDVDNCEGLAIDWMGKNLYWTDDALGQISVARLSAPKQRKVLIREPHYHPRSIALDPRKGVMYWSVWASSSTPKGSIETAAMDGSGRRVLVSEELHWPNGLVVQSDEQMLYWCDTFLNKIESLDLASNKRTTIISAPSVDLQKPYGLALIDGDIIWSEHGTGNIRRLGADGQPSPSANGTILRRLPPPLYDIRRVAAADRLGRNTCSDTNGGCSELCLAAPGGHSCACAACAPGPAPPPCAAGKFHCGRGRCIDELYVCDGDADCPDGSDEDSSPTGPCANRTCTDSQNFKCDSNRCIPKTWICDGQRDCLDGSDESDSACAEHVCGPDQFLCTSSKRCIAAAWRCDGAPDCGNNDRSDEADCKATENAECHPLMFRCPNGGCVPWEYYCDGRADCADGGDEQRCRGVTPTRNDEVTNKNSVCEEHEFQCANKECIRKEFRCDYRPDCLDSSDEANCEQHRATTRAPTTPPPDECVAPALQCDNGSRCVPLLQLCDGSYDCADGSDEADRCGEPMCVAAACTHECHPTPSGAVCACPATLHLQRDGFTCSERHICHDWGVCSQTCQPQKNRHKCTCYEGYELADDGFTCKSTEKATPLLVFSNRHEVRAVELPSLTSRALISSLKNTVALDWKRTGDQVTLYWTDVVDDHIYSGTVQGIALSDIKVVIEQGVSTAEGLAVDWVANNLYWVEGTLRQIEVARLDGRYRRTLVSGDMESPRAIALDPKHGYLFWSDWEQSAPRIERCSMAGTDRTTVVHVDEIADGAWPNGVTLDHVATRLYWIDAKYVHGAKRCSMAGADRTTVVHVDEIADGAWPNGVTLDHVATRLYWIDAKYVHGAKRCSMAGADRTTVVHVDEIADCAWPNGVTLDHVATRLYWIDAKYSAPRIERCSMAGTDRTTVVHFDEIADGAWPNGVTLDHVATRLYWIDAKSDSIHTTLYDGTGYQLVLRGHAMLSHPFAVTLFESHVYWTDWRSNSVMRANKWNGSDVQVVQRTMMQPFDIKVIHPSRQPALLANPCAIDNGNCTHLCLIDGPNVRVCACPHVMRLAKDNVTCEVHEKVVVVGRAGSIRGLDLDAPSQPVIPAVWGAQLAAPRALAALTSQRLLYWSDAEVTSTLYRWDKVYFTLEPVIPAVWGAQLAAPRALAALTSQRLLYWSDAEVTSTLYRWDKVYFTLEPVIPAVWGAQLAAPRALAALTSQRLLYWSDAEVTSTLYRWDKVYFTLEPVIPAVWGAQLAAPRALAALTSQRLLYWSDAEVTSTLYRWDKVYFTLEPVIPAVWGAQLAAPRALAALTSQRLLYWSDAEVTSTLYRWDKVYFTLEPVIPAVWGAQLAAPRALAALTSQRLLYWSDAEVTSTLYRWDKVYFTLEPVIPAVWGAQLAAPRALAALTSQRLLYWSDAEVTSTLYRWDKVYFTLEPVIPAVWGAQLAAPRALAALTSQRLLYWSDAEVTSTLYRWDKVYFTLEPVIPAVWGAQLAAPRALAALTSQRLLYWSDAEVTSTLYRWDKVYFTLEPVIPAVWGAQLAAPRALAALTSQRLLYWSDAEVTSTLYRWDKVYFTLEPVIPAVWGAQLAAPRALAALTSQRLLYWSDAEVTSTLYRWDKVYFTLEPVIPAVWGAQLAAPRALAALTSQRLLYWSDAETNEIKRTRLTGGTAETVVEAAGVGGALALDWAAKVLYYAVQGQLWAAGPLGERASPLCAVANVTAIAVDVQRGKLYWAVSSTGDGIGAKMEAAASDCSERRVIIDATRDPLLAGVHSLTVEPKTGWLYWVNLASASIQYIDVKTGEFFTVELATGARPLALDIHFERLLWADGDGLKACNLPRERSQATQNCVDSEVLRPNTENVLSLLVYDAATQNATRGACALRAPAAACAHACLPVAAARSRCVCAAGYTANGTQCIPEDEILVYSLSWEIRALSLTAPSRTVLPPIAQPALCTALDYRADGDWIYWADSESGAVARARRDGTGRAALVSQPEPLDAQPVDWLSGLAVDWVAGNIYWSDPRRNLVEVARANGDHRYVLIDTDPLAVTTLAVDAVRGWLFLSGGGWIQRSRLDGSQRELLYNGTAVADIALDSENEMVYWADTFDVSLWRMRYDGRSRACVARGDPLRHPAAVAVHAARLYWIDTMWKRGCILSAPLTNISDYQVLLENAGDNLKDLFIWSKASQTLPSPSSGLAVNPCSVNNGGCAELCLWDGASAHCACPHGDVAADGKNCTPYQSFLMYSGVTKIDSIHLQDEKDLNSPYLPIQNKDLIRIAISLAYWYDEKRLFYSDIQRGAIGSVHFNGTDHKTLLTKMGAVEGMVFESRTRTLYWTCNSAAVRRVHIPSLDARADNQSSQALVRTVIQLSPGDRPRGIDVDSCESYENIVSGIQRWLQRHLVVSINTKFQSSQALVRTVIQLAPGDRPRGIDVDSCESRLYWTNWNDTNPRIQRAYSSGHELETIISKDILMPNGLAIEHSTRMLYWADARLDKIERSLLDGSHRHIVVRSGAEHPFDVAACDGYVYWSDWVGRAILRADARGGNTRALRKDLPRPMGLVCVTPTHQTCSPDPCATLNGGCAELCTLSAEGVVCACRPGRELNPDRSSCRPTATHCEDGQFACAEGLCIPEELVCDGVNNCGSRDASDEDLYYCTSRVCPADMTPCGAGGRCVRTSSLCDGFDDCDDGSDERSCECPAQQYRCTDGMCVPVSARCDGLVDCLDGSDEAGCPRGACAALGAGAAPCGGGGCFLPEWRCDGAKDCPDGTDEQGCEVDSTTRSSMHSLAPCDVDQFTCGSPERGDIECIPLTWRCDGVVDCSDGSDETLHCGKTAASDVSSPATALNVATSSFTCDSPERGDIECIPLTWRCDGVVDCSDGSDETLHCGKTAASDFTCDSPERGDIECIPLTWRCDGVVDCSDGSDETLHCGKTAASDVSSPAALNVATSSVYRCHKNTSKCTVDQFSCGALCLPLSARCDGSADCPRGEDEADCSLTPLSVRCDGSADCPRGEDEADCSCAPTAFRCASDKTCLHECTPHTYYICLSLTPLSVRCDGSADCPRGEDEADCSCAPTAFRCASDKTCLHECTPHTYYICLSLTPLSVRCDGSADCPRGEDEADCSCAPTAFRCASDKTCLHEVRH
ncbi:prolow-density lipoprotein receptor-related protein 1-like [Cydia splendana]|uniref:prolow-density lipoprotein receptor-related protein 1-like n=1 Tax=Cydia splendana TaxID=1100963 RepID=UPI00300C3ADB